MCIRDSTYTEQIPFDTVTQENENQDQTYRETVQQGCAGTAQVTAEIETVDGEERTRTILARTVLRQATDEIVEVGTRNVGIGTGEFAVPLNSYTFTSAFKYRWGRPVSYTHLDVYKRQILKIPICLQEVKSHAFLCHLPYFCGYRTARNQ